jgi:uncharacterized protein YkwD
MYLPPPSDAAGKPHPIPEDKDRQAGYPITVAFPSGAAVTGVQARLTAGDRAVDAWLSTPEKPFDRAQQRNTVVLIAKDPLRPKTTYSATVSAKVGGREFVKTWSFTTGAAAAGEDRDAIHALVLKELNAHRSAAGLRPVEGLDALLSKGCQAHAEYLVRNAGNPSAAGLGVHDEDPKLPGFTEEGRRAAKASVISTGGPHEAVDGWMATFYHRIPLLDPELRRIGFGWARGAGHAYAVLDAQSGRGGDTVVFYPADGQKAVPLAFHPGGEQPNPVPDSKDKKAGYPVTVQFPAGALVRDVTASLTDVRGREVPSHVWTPEKPVAAGVQRNSVGLIAKEPLKPDTAYTVWLSATVNGQERKESWTFRTTP